MSIDLDRTRLSSYVPTWAGYDFGAVDKVTPDLILQTKPLKVGSMGDVELGQRIIGLTGKVVIEAREVDVALKRKMLPWYTSGPIRITPATINKDLYDYAGLLTLHPKDLGGTDEDLNLLKAVPLYKPMDRDGVNDDKSIITVIFFPDRDDFPELNYGYWGAVPA